MWTGYSSVERSFKRLGTVCGLWFVEGVAECVVDPLDGGALVVVPGLLIDARHADPVVQFITLFRERA